MGWGLLLLGLLGGNCQRGRKKSKRGQHTGPAQCQLALRFFFDFDLSFEFGIHNHSIHPLERSVPSLPMPPEITLNDYYICATVLL